MEVIRVIRGENSFITRLRVTGSFGKILQGTRYSSLVGMANLRCESGTFQSFLHAILD